MNPHHHSDTIVAVSTTAGAAPVAILRVSGAQAVPLVGRVFRSRSGRPISEERTYTALPGRLEMEGRGSPACPVTVYLMRAPYSYTREDVVELHAPGAPPLLERILQGLVRAGARLAEPGEFTRRAFLNGRLDLTQAESVMAVVRSRSESELRAATQQLRGALTHTLRPMRDELADLCALTETAIDFSDQDIQVLSPGRMAGRLRELAQRVGDLRARPRRLPSEAVTAAIAGQPNVGKSSLFNALIERYGGKAVRRRAMVSRAPGTTRDTLEASIVVHGVTFRLVDTAGLRESADEVEVRAVRRARTAREEADLTLLVLDATDKAGALRLPEPDGRTVVVMNKIDLLPGTSPILAPNAVAASAVTGQGLEDLAKRMAETVLSGGLDRSGSVLVANARHQEALGRAQEAIGAAASNLESGLGLELAAFELRAALNAIGEIIGEVTTEDLLDRIFARFCIGK
jgi:tRNA modification GTPase